MYIEFCGGAIRALCYQHVIISEHVIKFSYLFKCEYGYVIISGICNWELKDHFTLEHMHVLIVAYIISWWKPSSNAHQYNIYIHTIFT